MALSSRVDNAQHNLRPHLLLQSFSHKSSPPPPPPLQRHLDHLRHLHQPSRHHHLPMESALLLIRGRTNRLPLSSKRPPLNSKQMSLICLSIVAIHGLDGHRDESWTTKSGVMWLKDLLPAQFPTARIITYGYDAATHGTQELSNQTIFGHAQDFLVKFTSIRAEVRHCLQFLGSSLNIRRTGQRNVLSFSWHTALVG